MLKLISDQNFEVEFEIESNDVLFIDDLVLYTGAQSAHGTQVKFHVTQDFNDSFDTLTAKKTAKSHSLIEKLYKGWSGLKAAGITDAAITFISSNPPERGRYKLGPVISNEDGKFNDKFFEHRDYESSRQRFAADLKISLDELKEFLNCVEWKFGYESIDSLRRNAAWHLKHLQLPHDDDAVSRVIEVVGKIANSCKARRPLKAFIYELWQTSKFRDACERRFPNLEFGTSMERRASILSIASVSLHTLPAYAGQRFACLDEPFPFADYRHGVSFSDNEGLLSANRNTWRITYIEWLRLRVAAILKALRTRDLDFLIFPRFSLPIEVACEVAEWCREHKCNLICGGQSWPVTQHEKELYTSSLNVTLPDLLTNEAQAKDAVIDTLVRFDRAGRASVSHLETPFAKSENSLVSPEIVSVMVHDGWISMILLPSKSSAKEFVTSGQARPELIIASGGIHASDIVDELSQAEGLNGLPLAALSSDTRVRSCAANIESKMPSLQNEDGWEGVRLYNIGYDRSVSGWSADCDVVDALPLAYHKNESAPTSTTYEHLRGLFASRNEAISCLQRNELSRVIFCLGESPPEFFYRRAKEAEIAIRACLSLSSPAQMVAFSGTLENIASQSEALRIQAFVPEEIAPTPQVLLPPRVKQFFNRASEKADIGRFLTSSPSKSILLLYGQTGIGKRELLNEVQRLSAARNQWIRFRCPPEARLLESVCQLLVRLGVSEGHPTSCDSDAFLALTKAVRKNGAPVIVLEDAHFLPLAKDHQDHIAFLDLLAFLCSANGPNIKWVLTSDWKGSLQFAGSNRLQLLRIDGMRNEYIVELLQEHVSLNSYKYEPATVDELEALASRLHGHPFLARLAAGVLQDTTAAEVIGKLYLRTETRNFITGRLLAGMPLSDSEKRVLHFASLLRIPVSADAFKEGEGPIANRLVHELVNRFLIIEVDDKYALHPILREFFSSSIASADDRKRFHATAFDYYTKLSKRSALTIEERTEYVYHGVSAGKTLQMQDLQMFAGSMRAALSNAVRRRDWHGVESAASNLLAVWPFEVTGQVGMALALDAMGRESDALQYLPSLDHVTTESLWLALEFVRSLVRRRDFDAAERNLATISQQFPDDVRVALVNAQLLERQGLTKESIEACERILRRPGLREKDAFLAALMLRDANRLDLLITHMQDRYQRGEIQQEGLLRTYSLALVVTGHDPNDGLQLLSDLWQASATDGFAVADYATALISVDRIDDACNVLERGLEEVPASTMGYRQILEAVAFLYQEQEAWEEACKYYREATSRYPNFLHIQRRFARCLLDAASSYRESSDSAKEDVVVNEAKLVIGRLLQLAPRDTWASDMLHRAEARTYTKAKV